MLPETDSLRQIENVSSSSPRVVTPSKQRSVTPVKSTQPQRSSSAPRVGLLKSVFDAQSCNGTFPRSASVRKQRRWENSNLRPSDIEDDSQLDEAFGLRVDWKSNFSQLFKAEHNREMESFRKCQIGACDAVPSTSKRSFRKDAWGRAEKIWLERVEKRLRSVVAKTLQLDEDLCEFVRAFEILLSYYLMKGRIPPPSLVPGFAQHLQHEKYFQVESGRLVIPLVNSPFKRLLVHATVQFYGLRSKVPVL